MAGNSFGQVFKITTFGESHGAALGVVIDGCPANMPVDLTLIARDLERRRPGQSLLTTQRNEPDQFEILSGVFEGKTLGSPIAVIVRNKDAKSADYDALKDVYRPSHADYTYTQKYGIRDHRGGGRQSARETISRVIAGSFAKMLLAYWNISIQAAVCGVGQVNSAVSPENLDYDFAEHNIIKNGDPLLTADMINAIEKARDEGDSLGGTIACICKGLPAGWGEPVFDKLNAELGKAMLSINAVKGFEFGAGFGSTQMKGSQMNDAFVIENGNIATQTNFSGGIQGGISNGMPVWFKVAFKPVSSIKKEQESVDNHLNSVSFSVNGRHDPCVVPRAVAIVEAMAALVLADMALRQLTNQMQLF